MDVTLDITVKRIEFEHDGKWIELREEAMTILQTETVVTLHKELCKAFRINQELYESRLYMLKKEKLSMQSSGLHLIDGATYYVLFEPIENSSESPKPVKKCVSDSKIEVHKKAALTTLAEWKKVIGKTPARIDKYDQEELDEQAEQDKQLTLEIQSIIRGGKRALDNLVNNNKLPVDYYSHKLLNPALNNKIPAKQEYSKIEPDLLLFELEDSNIKINKYHKVRREIMNSKLSLLTGPSGSGKTRTAFEYLSCYFGFYVTMKKGKNHGSMDLEATLNEILQLENTEIALSRSLQLHFSILSMVAIRDKFLETLQREYDKKLKPYHWLVIQLMPIDIFGNDVFDELRSKFKCKIKPKTIVDEIKDRVPIFLDEAQVIIDPKFGTDFCSATTLNAFFSTYTRDKPDSALRHSLSGRPMTSTLLYSIDQLARNGFHAIVTGTGFKADEFRSSMGSNFCKSALDRETYIYLGHFLEYSSFDQYVSYYLPHLHHKEKRQVHSVLKGRYRLASRFVSTYLSSNSIESSVRHLAAVEKVCQSVVSELSDTLRGYSMTATQLLQKYSVLSRLLYKYSWMNIACIVSPSEQNYNDAWLVQAGLGLITSTNGANCTITVTDYSTLLSKIKIEEPIVFESINQLIGQTEMLNVFFELTIDELSRSLIDIPSMMGFIAESPICVQLYKLALEGSLVKGFRPIDRKRGCQICIYCSSITSSQDKSYSLKQFLDQTFKNGDYTYSAIISELYTSLPDLAMALVNKNGELGLLLVSTKFTASNSIKDISSLFQTDPESQLGQLIAKQFGGRVFRLLIQVGNEIKADVYRQANEKGVSVMHLKDLGFKPAHVEYVKKFRSKVLKVKKENLPQEHSAKRSRSGKKNDPDSLLHSDR